MADILIKYFVDVNKKQYIWISGDADNEFIIRFWKSKMKNSKLPTFGSNFATFL